MTAVDHESEMIRRYSAVNTLQSDMYPATFPERLRTFVGVISSRQHPVVFAPEDISKILESVVERQCREYVCSVLVEGFLACDMKSLAREVSIRFAEAYPKSSHDIMNSYLLILEVHRQNENYFRPTLPIDALRRQQKMIENITDKLEQFDGIFEMIGSLTDDNEAFGRIKELAREFYAPLKESLLGLSTNSEAYQQQMYIRQASVFASSGLEAGLLHVAKFVEMYDLDSRGRLLLEKVVRLVHNEAVCSNLDDILLLEPLFSTDSPIQLVGLASRLRFLVARKPVGDELPQEEMADGSSEISPQDGLFIEENYAILEKISLQTTTLELNEIAKTLAQNSREATEGKRISKRAIVTLRKKIDVKMGELSHDLIIEANKQLLLRAQFGFSM